MARSTRTHWSCSTSSGSRAQPRYDGSDIVAAVPPLQDGNSSLQFAARRQRSDALDVAERLVGQRCGKESMYRAVQI